MGFSLKNALAGAITGGAKAVGEIADSRIREAEQQRARDEQYAHQRQMMIEQDTILANRQQRADDFKTAREERVLAARAAMMRSGLAAARDVKVDPGSIKGQQFMAQYAAEAGFPDYADKFFDNAGKLAQIESNAEMKKSEIANRLEMARIAAGARSSGAGSTVKDKAYEKGYESAGKAGERILISDPNNPEKSIPFKGASSILQSLYGEMADNDMPDNDRRRNVNDAQVLMAQAIKANPTDPYAAAQAAANKMREHLGYVKVAKPANPAPPPQQPPAPKKPVTPGFFQRFGGSKPQQENITIPQEAEY